MFWTGGQFAHFFIVLLVYGIHGELYKPNARPSGMGPIAYMDSAHLVVLQAITELHIVATSYRESFIHEFA